MIQKRKICHSERMKDFGEGLRKSSCLKVVPSWHEKKEIISIGFAMLSEI